MRGPKKRPCGSAGGLALPGGTALLLCILLSWCCKRELATAGENEKSVETTVKGHRFVLGTRTYAHPPTRLPAKGVEFSDPIFQTRLVRITDKAKDRYAHRGIKQEYARSDPENSDGTLLVLRATGGEWYLYDARTYKLLKHLTRIGTSHEPEPRWDATRPKILYHLGELKLMELDVETGKNRVVHDFKREFPWGDYLMTGSEGDASLDRRYWCFMVKKDVDSTWIAKAVVVYDRSTDRIVGKLTRMESTADWVTMDMSGKRCVIGWDERAPKAYPRDFSRAVTLPRGVAHADLALTAAGRDVLVYQNFQTDWIAMADLETGQETELLRIPFRVNPDIGLHFSGNGARTRGWALVSSYGAKHPPRGRAHSWMDHQLFLLELKRAPRIWRIAHTRSNTFIRPDQGEKAYFAEPFAAMNTAGTRIYWGSNWEGRDLNRIELFAALLPPGWTTLLPAAR